MLFSIFPFGHGIAMGSLVTLNVTYVLSYFGLFL